MTPTEPGNGPRAPGIVATLFDADGEDREVDPTSFDLDDICDRCLLWLDLDLEAGADLDAVAERVRLTRSERRHLGEVSGRVRMGHSAESIHLTLEAVEPRDEGRDSELVRREIDLVARPGIVISVHRGRVAAIERFVEQIEGDTALGALRAADLLSSLADEVISSYHDVVHRIDGEIARLDQIALDGRRGDSVLREIVRLRRRIGLVRATLAPHRAALTGLGRPELDADSGVGQPWPVLVDRLEGAIAAVDSLRDALIGTYDIHMARSAQRTSDVMKALTIVSSVLLPAVVVAGVMGMNFRIPFFENEANFFLVIGVMLLFAAVVLGFARWRRWI
jgi:magnesium transporter